MSNWYVNSVGYTAVAQWAASHTYAAGAIVRQLAAVAAGSERCFRTSAGGTSGSSEPHWGAGQGVVTVTDNTITDWTEITGSESFQSAGSWAAPMARLPQPGITVAAPNTANGTGYVAGDLLNIVGGTFTQQAIVKVLTVTSGKPQTWQIYDPGVYSVAPGTNATTTAITGVGTSATVTGATTVGPIHHVAGDRFYVSSNHAETTAVLMNYLFAGTLTNPNEIVCISSSLPNVPAQGADVTTGAVVTNTGAAVAVTFAGSFHMNGVSLSAVTTTGLKIANQSPVTAQNTHQIIENATLTIGATSSFIQLGQSTGGSFIYLAEFVNVAIFYTNVNNTITMLIGAELRWRNYGQIGLAPGSAAPTTLIISSSGTQSPTLIELDGIDLSAMGSGKTIFNGGAVSPYRSIIRNCKLGSGVTLANTPTHPCAQIFSYNNDTVSSNYQSSKLAYEGIESTNISITRVGGATDGVTPQSRQIVTSANAAFSFPFVSMPMMIWNDLIGSTRNITIYGTINAGAPPANNELWLEVEYFEDTTSPMASFIDDRMANAVSTPAAQTADVASTWNGGGSGAGWSPFKLTVSFTAQQHGYIVCRVKAAKASTTYYIDPPGAGTLS